MPVGTTQGLITRCPDCSTAFRASAEQLSARDGQVRCGRCGRVFDAVENAVPVVQPPPLIDHAHDDIDTDVRASSAAPITPTFDFLAGQSSAVESSPRHDDDVLPGAYASEQAFPATERFSHDDAHAQSELPVEDNASMGAARGDPGVASPDAIIETEPAAIATVTEDEPSVAGTPVALQSDVLTFDTPRGRTIGKPTTPIVAPLEWEFGRPKKATGRVPRWMGIPGVLVLSVVLLGQIAHHLRSDLVLVFPSVRPAAEQVCEWAGCDLPSPQRAELMSIESSDLQADSTNPAVMVLSATLRNRAPFPQAPPALELTLTDAQDQPTARRVLNAEDYSLRGVQSNLFPASSELPIKVYFEASAVKATGYRLYLFYP